MADMDPTMPAEAAMPESQEAQPQGKEAVTIREAEDGTFMVNDQPAGDIDQALMKAKEILTKDDGGMSVQQAFQTGFKEAQGAPSMGY
jgi:hypothetical protein